MKKNKILKLTALGLAVAVTATGTLAYLKQQTTEVTNTFSAAKLVEDVTLDETEVEYDENTNTYKPVPKDPADPSKGNNKVSENTYDKIIPGVPVMKDPAIHLDLYKGIDAYLYVEVVENNFCDYLTYTVDDTQWTELGITGAKGGKLYAYKNVLKDTAKDGDDAEKTYYILKGTNETNLGNGYIAVKGNAAADGSDCKLNGNTDPAHVHYSGELKFYGYVCQAASFENATAAYEAAFITK